MAGSRIPEPDELQEYQTVRDLIRDREKNEVLLSEIAKMPERMRRLAIKLLSSTDKNFRQLCVESGYAVGPYSKVSTIKKRIEGKLGKALAEVGLSEYDLAAKARELLHATKKIPVKMEGGGIRLIEVPDYATQTAAWKHLTLLSGYKAPDRVNVNAKVKHSVENSRPEDAAHLRARQRELALIQIRKELPADYEVMENAGGNG